MTSLFEQLCVESLAAKCAVFLREIVAVAI